MTLGIGSVGEASRIESRHLKSRVVNGINNLSPGCGDCLLRNGALGGADSPLLAYPCPIATTAFSSLPELRGVLPPSPVNHLPGPDDKPQNPNPDIRSRTLDTIPPSVAASILEKAFTENKIEGNCRAWLEGQTSGEGTETLEQRVVLRSLTDGLVPPDIVIGAIQAGCKVTGVSRETAERLRRPIQSN